MVEADYNAFMMMVDNEYVFNKSQLFYEIKACLSANQSSINKERMIDISDYFQYKLVYASVNDNYKVQTNNHLSDNWSTELTNMKPIQWFKNLIGKKIIASHKTEGKGSLTVADNAHAEYLHKTQTASNYSYSKPEEEEDGDSIFPILTGILVGGILNDESSDDDDSSGTLSDNDVPVSNDADTPNIMSGDGDGFGGGGASADWSESNDTHTNSNDDNSDNSSDDLCSSDDDSDSGSDSDNGSSDSSDSSGD